MIGIDEAAVSAWLVANVAPVVLPVRFELIAGGHSNLTFKVTDNSGRAMVLRRPPLGHLLSSAHDMSREHAILVALDATDVPTPRPLALCADDAVNGAPFYVMDHIDGLCVHTVIDAQSMLRDDAARRHASESLVDTLAAIHAVDVDAVGLGRLGRKQDYVARQLRRWHGQWQQSKTRELPAIDEVHAQLARCIPEQGPAALVHGDYRLDNTLVSVGGDVRAVLDWELATLGDPLVDVGSLIVFWDIEAGDADTAVPTAPTRARGFMTSPEILGRYVHASGRDVTDINFYVAFANWKLACIIEGVYQRYVSGARGERSLESLQGFVDQVDQCAMRAVHWAERL
jgi:aminoglycoside phosphotransferase (APT) family kinase protein